MNHLLRICKCHWAGEHYEHWGRADERRPFVPPGTPPRFAPDTPVTGRHMHLALHLDVARERVHGTTTHELTVHAERVERVRFDAVALEVDAVRVDGRRAAFDNTGEAVEVTLPAARSRGETVTVAIDHAVTRPRAGLYFTNPDEAYPERFRTAWSQGQDEDSRYYFPCLDAPNFKQTSEAELYVPTGWFALSNGKLVRHEPDAGDGEALWHYRLDVPYSTYLFSVVAGRFAEHREQHEGLEVRWYVEPGREAEGRNAFGHTAELLRVLADFTGVPYPYGQYTQIAVPDFIFGGMENFTATTQTDLTLHDDRAHLDFASDDLVAHEAAHSWFGNLVTARSWAHAWLHESFATYLESVFLERQKGADERDYQLLRDAETYFEETKRYRRPLVTHRYEQPIDLFDGHLYPGGAVRLRHLHCLLGDEPFRATIRHYLQQHREGVAETVDLARSVEAVTANNYDWWFEQWVHGAGYPAFEVKYAWKADEHLADVTIKQTQPLDDGGDDAKHKRWFRVPLKLAFRVGRRFETFPVTVTEEETRVVFRLPRKPDLVLFDPDYECPVKQVTFDKPQDLLLNQLRSAPRPIARIEAAEALADKPAHTVVEALGRQLRRDAFWGVQQRIARALGKIGGESARDALLRGLRIRHPKARRAVVNALANFKDDEAVARALQRLVRRGDPSYYVEADAVAALGKVRAPRTVNLVRQALQRPSHAEVIRSGAFRALEALGDPGTLELAAEGARYGAPAMSRGAAIAAAGELGRRHPHLRQSVLDLLEGIARQQDNPAATFRGKMAAIRALGRLGDLDAVPVLRRIADTEADGRIVRLARTTVDRLRRDARKPQEMTALRTDVDQLTKENKSLRDRLEVLEQKEQQPRPQRAAQGKKG